MEVIQLKYIVIILPILIILSGCTAKQWEATKIAFDVVDWFVDDTDTDTEDE